MGSFRNSVYSLIETYSKCIALLKELRGTDDPHKLLKSVRADRSKVRKAYDSSLSRNGRLKKGDVGARSSLRRIIRRLTDTIDRLLNSMTSRQSSAVDYVSLQSLSNSSRIDAIKVIDDLSARLKSQTPSNHKSWRKSSSLGSANPVAASCKQRSGPSSTVQSGPGKQHKPQVRHTREGPTPLHDGATLDARKHASLTTMASGSTKLGEVLNELDRRRSGQLTPPTARYSTRPTYPLRPYKPKGSKGGFWSLFRS